MDRGTLLATVSRVSRKWKKLRGSVLQAVPSDDLRSQVGGQSHVFWSARVRESTENKDTYTEASEMFDSTQEHLARNYLHRRQRKLRKVIDEAPSSLAGRQARALSAALAALTLSPSRVTILCCCELLALRKQFPDRKDINTVRWEAGYPNPERVMESRPPSKKWESARTPADRLEAMSEDAPVAPTSCLRLDGRLELPSGTRPQKFVLPRGPALKYLEECRPDLLSHVGAGACNVGASWETSRPAFEQAAVPNQGVGHAGDLYRALGAGWESLRFSRMPQPSIKAVDSVKVNPQAFPGVVSSRLGRNRKAVFAASAEIAKDAYRDARSGFTPDLSLWACGGRGKYAMGAELGDDLKSRLVLMPETPSALLESAFSQPLSDMIGRCGGDVMIGSKMSDRGYRRVVNRFSDYSHCKAYDWSGFDARVREDMIVTAFGVMRACFFGEDEWLDNVFLRFLSHFLVKRVVTPGGWVYTLAKGVPSGSPFTSLVDSIVNWLVLVDLEIHMGGLHAPHVNSRIVYGDDFVQGYKRDPLGKEDFIRLAYVRWGFVAKLKAAYEGPFCTTDTRTSLPFLSYRFPCGLPARPVEDALQLALIPYKARATWSGQLSRVMYLDHFSPFDLETFDYHVGYFRWISNNIPGNSMAGEEAPDTVTPFIVKAMVNFTAAGYSPGVVSLGEWFRQERASWWPSRWIPRSMGCGLPVPNWRLGKVLSAASHLRYADTLDPCSIKGVPCKVPPW